MSAKLQIIFEDRGKTLTKINGVVGQLFAKDCVQAGSEAKPFVFFVLRTTPFALSLQSSYGRERKQRTCSIAARASCHIADSGVFAAICGNEFGDR